MNTHNTMNRTHTGILSLLAAFIILAVLVMPALAFQLNGQDVTAGDIGSTVEYPVILDEAPTGLAGYSITAELADGTIGEITAVSFPAWAGVNQHGTLPADSVLIRAADLNKNIEAGSTNVLLATLTIRADAAGTTPVEITINQVDDDNYDLVTPAVQTGSFTVPGAVTPTPTTTIDPTPTTTQTPAPTADFSADPTSGTAPLSVQFTDLSTGDSISAWAWDFDNDGTVDSTEQNPAYTYDTAGSYTVNLLVTGTGGDGEETKTDYITVTDSSTPTPTTTQPPAHTVPAVTAEVAGNTVVMNWDTINDADFLGYKVVVSKDNPNPAYPDDGYMHWITDRDTTSVTINEGDGYNGGDFGGSIVAGETYYFSVTAMYEPYEPVAGNVIQLTFPGSIVPAPVGAFSADPLSGTAPLSVQFTDESTGSITSWLWDVDNDGTVECMTRDCSYTYADAGTYTVKLTVSGDGGFDNVLKTDYITVTSGTVPAPVADFFADTTYGEAPLTVEFTGLSTGAIDDYTWDFNNDGVIDSTEQNPTYTYALPGTYTATLTVTGPGGSDDETKTDYITVTAAPTPTPAQPPVAGFSGIPTSGYAPLTVQFTDESSGDYTAIYWDFNNDLQPDSIENNPSYTFTEPGNYTVNMAVTGPGGLDYEIKVDYITVMEEPVPAPVAGFSADPASGDAPLFVQFTDESTGDITGYAWDFENDGVTDSTEQNPSHVYDIAGTYTVSLTVTGPGGADDETKTALITVTEPLAKPVANFTADPISGIAPLTVGFTDLSTGDALSAWAWDFDSDGSIENTEQNPQHTFAAPGVYSVTLTVTNAAGSDTKIKTGLITVTEPAPVAEFSADPLAGTVPLTVVFTDASTNAASYAWDFENDGIIDSTEQNPVYIFTTAGTYTVNLTVTNSAASASEIKADYITVSPAAPVAGFSANATTGTAPLAVIFMDESTGQNITAWAWDFENDGSVDSTEQNPEHIYSQPGVYNVSLTATNAGGSDTMTREQYITATMAAPVANFTANQTSGYAPFLAEFADASEGTVESFAWDFENDGIVDSTEQNPVHTYAAAGNYTVNLTVANAGGSSESVKADYIIVKPVPAPVVEFTANLTAGYAPLAVQFTDESSGIGLISWSWDFNNDNIVDSNDQNPAYNFATPGNYTVSLAVKGSGGTVTTTKTDFIIVSAVPPAAPRAEFIGKPTSGTAPLTVTFTDKSVGKNILSWAWDFNGDGVTDSIEQNPSYTYSSKGKYNVSLTVTNAGGSDEKFKKNYIKVSQLEKPTADFKANKQSGNAPLTVKFTDKSTGDSITEWSWDFNNDGVIDSTQKNPTYTYASAGRYAVKLVVTNAAGSDMEIKSDFITVKGDTIPSGKKPIAVIFADKTWGTPPMTVKFADQSRNDPTSRTWFFGDGTSSTEENPTHLYADPGIYFARLYVENSAGTDQDFRFIFVLPKWLAFWSGQ
jgi:PKD repeat protein